MKIITLSREYGAGGHSVGTKVAEKLGIEFYDRDIIRNAAKLSGISEEEIIRQEEQVSKGSAFIRSVTPISFDFRDMIFDYERIAITELAEKQPCVILGRCAGTILKNAGIECVNILLTADVDHRAKRVGELINSQDVSEILRAMKKADNARHAYYSYYTGHSWGDYHDFDMILDTGTLGYDTCIELICAAAVR